MSIPIIRFKVTDERTELLPMGIYRRFDRDPDAQLYFVAHFMLDGDGRYILQYDSDGMYKAGAEQAWAILDPLPVIKIKDLVDELAGRTEEAAVPKA